MAGLTDIILFEISLNERVTNWATGISGTPGGKYSCWNCCGTENTCLFASFIVVHKIVSATVQAKHTCSVACYYGIGMSHAQVTIYYYM